MLYFIHTFIFYSVCNIYIVIYIYIYIYIYVCVCVCVKAKCQKVIKYIVIRLQMHFDKCKIENTETSVKDLYCVYSSYIMFLLLF